MNKLEQLREKKERFAQGGEKKELKHSMLKASLLPGKDLIFFLIRIALLRSTFLLNTDVRTSV